MHVVIDLSPHGFGHLGMTVPIINGLCGLFDDVKLTLRSEISERVLRERLPVPFRVAPPPPDPGMAMRSPFDVDSLTSATRYDDLFASWSNVISVESGKLRALKADLILANVPFVSLAAANALGIPAVGFSSINWADVYIAYCAGWPKASEIYSKILGAYNCAKVFLRPTPSMPMDELSNQFLIGPVARVGQEQRDKLIRNIAHNNNNERFVLISFGGISGVPDFQLPELDKVRWLVPDDYVTIRNDITRFSACEMPFIDLLASSDVVVTKPGYGLIVEAACNGVKVAYIPRHDWPEEPYALSWLESSWVGRELNRDAFIKGNIGREIEELLSLRVPERIAPTGVDEALSAITKLLSEPASNDIHRR